MRLKPEGSEHMSTYEVAVKWIDNLRYVASSGSGHAIVLDVPAKSGGNDSGMHATELLLIAVGKCTAVDVVRILTKQKKEIRSLEVIVTGDISAEYPKFYEKIHIKYRISGDGLTMEQVQKAVDLSHGKYCTVSNSLTDRCEQTLSIEII